VAAPLACSWLYTNQGGKLRENETLEVDFVSLIDQGTHGPPALVAPGRERGANVAPVARVEDRVLYINTTFVPAFTIERLHDRP
jgi:hypothetical protein